MKILVKKEYPLYIPSKSGEYAVEGNDDTITRLNEIY